MHRMLFKPFSTENPMMKKMPARVATAEARLKRVTASNRSIAIFKGEPLRWYFE